MIRVGPEHVRRSIEVLRTCGQGRRECVVYWVAEVDQDGPSRVVDVVHPSHTASGGGYAVDGAWLTVFFLNLAEKDRTAVAQLHTHPGEWTDHSRIDDEFVLIPSPGFVSIVLPDFAGVAALDRSNWRIHVLTSSGEWREAMEVVEW